jgi:hypothetical protein
MTSRACGRSSQVELLLNGAVFVGGLAEGAGIHERDVGALVRHPARFSTRAGEAQSPLHLTPAMIGKRFREGDHAREVGPEWPAPVGFPLAAGGLLARAWSFPDGVWKMSQPR